MKLTLKASMMESHNEPLLNRPLFKDISIYQDNSIKISFNKDKNIKVSRHQDLNKDRSVNKLSQEAIKEFQDLCEKKFGVRPTKKEAETDLLKLMHLIVLIL